MTPEAILDDLSLLLHSIFSKWLSQLDLVSVRIGTDAEPLVQQCPDLGDHPSHEVAAEAPGLKLPTVRELVREGRQVIVTVVGEEHVVAQRHGSVAASPEYRAPQQTRSTLAAAVQAYAPAVDYCAQVSQRGMLLRL